MKHYAKALIGAAVAGLTAIGTALEDGAVSPQEWITAATAVLVAFGAVWVVPNKTEVVEHDHSLPEGF